MSCYCDYGEGEPPKFSETRMVKARKEHKCIECLEPIKKGEEYQRCSGLWDGGFNTYRTCKHCADLRNEIVKNNPYSEGIAFGDLACVYYNEVANYV